MTQVLELDDIQGTVLRDHRLPFGAYIFARIDDAAHGREFIRRVIDGFDHLSPYLDQMAERHGQKLLDAHRRVRIASRARGIRYDVQPQLPPDLLGIYIFLPARGK